MWNQESTPTEDRQFACHVSEIIRSAGKTKYKPVAKRKSPIPVSVPNHTPERTEYKTIYLPPRPPLPPQPPPISEFPYSSRITEERLKIIISNIPKEFLRKKELDLLLYVLRRNEQAIAFTDSERGRFKEKYFPDYIMETVPHVPWQHAPIRIPRALEKPITDLLRDQANAGNLEPSRSSYRSRIFTVLKPSGGLRIVHDLQPLNAVSVRDAMLPPNINEFADSFVGYSAYGVMDLYSGYHQRTLFEQSRPLTACQTPIGNMQLTSLPIGYTNSLQEFQRTTSHTCANLAPDRAGVFVDDIGIKGPKTRYNDEPIPQNPEIRRFIWEYAHTVDEMLATFIEVGCTASGKKLVLATPLVHIVGNVCSLEGRRPHHSLITKVLNWPRPTSVTAVRGFLGTAGVARNWIWQYAKIAKPLTQLTKLDNADFAWNEAAESAMDTLKDSITRIPALRALDIESAKVGTIHERTSDLGLVTLAVDSSQIAVGFVLYQNFEDGRHPLTYRSITWNGTESAYSQPKIELYGLFRALKALRFDLWGILFRVEVDAKFLKEMINTPGLPNAAMTRWISYIQLFDFELLHVPAAQHVAPDGLSRREPTEEDTTDSDDDLEPGESGHFITGMRPTDKPNTSIFILSPEEQAELTSKGLRALINTHLPKDNAPTSAHVSHATETEPHNPAYTPRALKEPVKDKFDNHEHKIYDNDGEAYWKRIETYLDTLRVPKDVTHRKSFIQTTRRYFLYDNRLWRRTKSAPLLVIRTLERRNQLLAEAHDDSGHRGRDPTYKKLHDTYYWPNMISHTAHFCRTCRECQLRSAYRPKIQLNPTYVPTILRKINMDVVDMSIASDGYRYIIDARDDLTGWIEARMLKTKDANSVADFLYQDLICRFGCIPQITSDNGKEFEGAFERLTAKYGVPLVKSSPYHPEGNGMIERGHRTWINSIWRLCGRKKNRWSQFFFAAMWADRVTTRRTTGFSPYFLLYGKPHLFPFHITDRSWFLLDWHNVRTRTGLLTLRTRQLAALWRDRKTAANANVEARIRAAQDHAKRNARRLVEGNYSPGTLVIVYQAKFDVHHKFRGRKYQDRWAGPYRVRRVLESGSYTLNELDGTAIKGSIAANRIKLFHSREKHPTRRPLTLSDDTTTSDDLGPNALAEPDSDYKPTNSTTYIKNPNWLISYKINEPDWDDVWDRWQQRKLATTHAPPLTLTDQACEDNPYGEGESSAPDNVEINVNSTR